MGWIDELAARYESREAELLSPHACPSTQALRRFPERYPTALFRPPFFRDADRITHSLAYARYVDKTQVFSLFENDHLTHRSQHVQFVSRISRAIGRALALNEDLVEAIALGHDIGHTPFGHDGERYLDAICREQGIGAFVHNAQSVRALMLLERDGEGLNLSLPVLDGILCHNGELLLDEYRPGPSRDWETLEALVEACLATAGPPEPLVPMTLEGCVVRVADVIAYIGRDFEDAIRIRLIGREELPERVRAVLGDTNTLIVNRLVLDLVEGSRERPALSFSPEVRVALAELMEFNATRIYRNPSIKGESVKIERVFRLLFDSYCAELAGPIGHGGSAFAEFWNRMPESYRRMPDPRRAVVDFIAGMTDDFCYNQFLERFVPRKSGYLVEGAGAE